MGVFQKDSFTGEFVDAWKSTMASLKMNQVNQVAGGKQICVTDLPTVCISRRSGNSVVTLGLPAVYCTISAVAYGCICILYMYQTFIALQFDWLHWDSSASNKILTWYKQTLSFFGVRSAYQFVVCLDLSAKMNRSSALLG